MWGRTGPYTTKEWLMAGARSFSRTDGSRNLDVFLRFPDEVDIGQVQEGQIEIKNTSDQLLRDITVDFPDMHNGVKIYCETKHIPKIAIGNSISVPFKVIVENHDNSRMGRYMISNKITHNKDLYSDFNFFWVKNTAPDEGKPYR
ncbi:hypothetical protein ACFLTD_01535, partial [Elusimicrobiota bacterium]